MKSAVRNLSVVEDVDPDAFRNKRVLVECFFGRLKKYGVFGAKWTMSVDLFDVFFDSACAMTNVDIMFNPLDAQDGAFNDEVVERWQAREARRRRDGAEANREYRRRTALERLAQADTISRDIRVMSSLLFPEPTNHN